MCVCVSKADRVRKIVSVNVCHREKDNREQRKGSDSCSICIHHTSTRFHNNLLNKPYGKHGRGPSSSLLVFFSIGG